MKMQIPCPQHYIIEEKKWIDEHRYFMGLDYHRPVSSNEAVDDFLKREVDENHLTLEEKFEIFYTGTFILPACFHGDINPIHSCWIKSRLDEFYRITEKHFSDNGLEKQTIAA